SFDRFFASSDTEGLPLDYLTILTNQPEPSLRIDWQRKGSRTWPDTFTVSHQWIIQNIVTPATRKRPDPMMDQRLSSRGDLILDPVNDAAALGRHAALLILL